MCAKGSAPTLVDVQAYEKAAAYQAANVQENLFVQYLGLTRVNNPAPPSPRRWRSPRLLDLEERNAEAPLVHVPDLDL